MIASYYQKEQKEEWLLSFLSLLLPTDYREDSWTNTPFLIKEKRWGTEEGGGTFTVTLSFNNIVTLFFFYFFFLLLSYIFPTHFIKIDFF